MLSSPGKLADSQEEDGTEADGEEVGTEGGKEGGEEGGDGAALLGEAAARSLGLAVVEDPGDVYMQTLVHTLLVIIACICALSLAFYLI